MNPFESVTTLLLPALQIIVSKLPYKYVVDARVKFPNLGMWLFVFP